MSLHNMTLLRKPKVHSFVIGCSNVLFKQQMHCPWDVLVDVNSYLITAKTTFLLKLFCEEYFLDVHSQIFKWFTLNNHLLLLFF